METVSADAKHVLQCCTCAFTGKRSYLLQQPGKAPEMLCPAGNSTKQTDPQEPMRIAYLVGVWLAFQEEMQRTRESSPTVPPRPQPLLGLGVSARTMLQKPDSSAYEPCSAPRVALAKPVNTMPGDPGDYACLAAEYKWVGLPNPGANRPG